MMAEQKTQLVGIGFGNYISAEKLVSVLSPDSAPIKRVISDSRERGLLIDASFGRSTRSVLVMNSGHLILSALSTDEIRARITGGMQESEVPTA